MRDGVALEEPWRVVHLVPGFADGDRGAQLAAVTSTLGHAEGRIADTVQHEGRLILSGTLPTRRLLELVRSLPDLTRGEGVLQTEIDHDQPVVGAPPVRPRIGPDPLDGETWFRERPR